MAVGANSIVTKDVPPYTIVAGQPAKVIKEVPEKFDIMIILLNYWEKKELPNWKLQIISLLSNSGVKYVIKYITAPKTRIPLSYKLEHKLIGSGEIVLT